MKPMFLILAACLILPALASQTAEAPPTYKGLVCMGWVKPEAQSLADGDSEGEALVVNTPLTGREKEQLYYARQESEAAYRKEEAVKNLILAHHHLLFPLHHGSDWVRSNSCGDMPMIRSDEYHITQFVPSNPNYPGDGNWQFSNGFYSGSPANCRAYFSEMRTRAVAAKYGTQAEDRYIPSGKRR